MSLTYLDMMAQGAKTKDISICKIHKTWIYTHSLDTCHIIFWLIAPKAITYSIIFTLRKITLQMQVLPLDPYIWIKTSFRSGVRIYQQKKSPVKDVAMKRSRAYAVCSEVFQQRSGRDMSHEIRSPF